MKQDVFLITATAALKRVNKKSTEAKEAYDLLTNPSTKYGESIFTLFLMYKEIAELIEEHIEQYQEGVR